MQHSSNVAQKPPVSLKGKYIICDGTANLIVIVTHLVVDGFNEPNAIYDV